MTATHPPINIPIEQLSDEEFRKRWQSYLDDFDSLPQEDKIAHLIKLGVLTPEGKLPVYPMDDHVPYGPQS